MTRILPPIFAALFCALFFVMIITHNTRAEEFPGGLDSGEKMELEKGFSEASGMTSLDQANLDKDRLDLGGTLWSELNTFQYGSAGSSGTFLLNPNTLWLYLDGKLKNDVRGFVKFRAIYDPTTDGATFSPFTGRTSQEVTTLLDELKLQFQLSKKVFFTVGKQKLRWGTGKFWNPTDFLNSQRFDFRYGQDIRTGMPLVKMHVPVGASNFYLIESIEDANRPQKVQHAVRGELAVGPGEVSVSTIVGAQKKPVYALDGSSAIGPIDAYFEVGHSLGSTSWTSGVSYDHKYTDTDTVSLGLEYFKNGLGVSSTNDYVSILLSGRYQPFYLAREYGMFLIYLPAPGNWDHTNFSIFNLANLSDKSAFTRFEVTTSTLQGMSVTFALGLHYGKSDGEFKLGGQNVDGTVRLMANF